MSHDPPEYQRFDSVTDVGRSQKRKSLIEDVNRVGTFDVCCPFAPNATDCEICCVGYLAPCCLVGSTREMLKNEFEQKIEPCEGGCNGHCCGICVSSCFLTTVLPFGYFGALINGAVATQCLRVYESERDDWCVRWILMSFCFPCEACADIGNKIEILMPSPMIGYETWQVVNMVTRGVLPDTFEYEEAEEVLFKKTFKCPNGRLTCSEMVELIIDFECSSGHRAHKSWFGGIDCKWVHFEGMRQVFDGVYYIVYGS